MSDNAIRLQLRRGSESDHENFVGAPGEVTVDTTNHVIRIHDGVTEGGHAQYIDEQGMEALVAEAEGYRDDAQIAKENAENFSSDAEDHASAAHSSLNSAEDARDKAEEWANADEDVQVEEGLYSAAHWATKAAKAAEGAMSFQGGHDASTGEYPDTTDAEEGWFWKITEEGEIDGRTMYPGDSIIYDGDGGWVKIGTQDRVISVAGKQGEVTLDRHDVGLGEVRDVEQYSQGEVDSLINDAESHADSAVSDHAGELNGVHGVPSGDRFVYSNVGRRIYVSSGGPSGGNNGDLWFQYD